MGVAETKVHDQSWRDRVNLRNMLVGGPVLFDFIPWRLFFAGQRFRSINFALLPTLPLFLGPLPLLNFSTPLLERVLIFCQA
jgi:hypothetical protein